MRPQQQPLEYVAEENPIYSVSGTDGAGAAHLNLKVGGDRRPFPIPSKKLPKDIFNLLMHDSKVYLNGGEVFAFTLRVVPKLIDDVSGLGWSTKRRRRLFYLPSS